MGMFFVKKVENGGVFVKKWTFPQRRVLYVHCTASVFFILRFTNLRGAYTPNAPPLPTGLVKLVRTSR